MKQAEPINIFSYQADGASIKNRITLQQNLFSFLLEGEKTVYYAGTMVSIIPGQFLLLAAGNCLMSEKIAASGGNYKSILISFDNRMLADFFIRQPDLLRISIGNTKEEPVLCFEQDAFLQNFISSLESMLAGNQAISANMQQLKLHELLLYLGESYPGALQKLRGMNQGAADEIIIKQAVNANIDYPVSVEELAFLCNVSLSTFKRRFALIYGTSPSKWLLEKRMQKAANLLKQGNNTASEIYFQLGYENLSSFIQSFKQVHGITPKQYQLIN
jgi:AraC-like DNA-binding protein